MAHIIIKKNTNLFVKVSISFEKIHVFCTKLIVYFIGMVGDWKNHFSPEMNQKLDLWIETNLEGTGLKFITEI